MRDGIDHADCDLISGWAYNGSNDTPVNVVVYYGTTQIAVVTANAFRSDLAAYPIGNGYHAWALATPDFVKDGQNHAIHVKYQNTNTELSGSPLSFSCAYDGWIDSLSTTNIGGWAIRKDMKSTPIGVDLYDGSDLLLPGQIAGTHRGDLEQLFGSGNGNHGFDLALPSSLNDGLLHYVSIRYGGTERHLGNSPLWAPGNAALAYTGWVQTLNCNEIIGWAYDANHPETSVTVSFYSDNSPTPFLTATADVVRSDLLEPLGSANHGFIVTMPATDGAAHMISTLIGGRTAINGSPSYLAPCGSSSPDFSMSVTPASAGISVGGMATYKVTVSPLNGFNSQVTLQASNLPTGMSATFNPTSLASGQSTMTITDSTNAIVNASSFTVTGTGGGLTRTAAASVTVQIMTPPSATMSSAGGTGAFFLQTAGCWTATSNDPWITITSGTNVCTVGTVGYSIAPNGTGASRTGSIIINNEPFALTQLAPPTPVPNRAYSPPILADTRQYRTTYTCVTGDCSGFTPGSCTVGGAGVSAVASNATLTTVDVTFTATLAAATGLRSLTCPYSKSNINKDISFNKGPSVIGISIQQVNFYGTGNIPLTKDTSSSLVDIPNTVSSPVWKASNPPENNDPVAYSAGSTMSVSLKFLPTPAPEEPIPGYVRIEGHIANLGTFVATGVTLDSGFSLRIVSATADSALPAMTKLYDPMSIDWSISSATTACSPGCSAAGSSAHKVYVTLGQPTVTPVYLTVLDLAVNGVTATSQPQAFEQTWAKFAGPANVTAWYNTGSSRQPLYYYRNDPPYNIIGFGSCASSPPTWPGDLLVNFYHSGQCGSFARLFLRALATNGIQVYLGPSYTPNPAAQASWTNVAASDGSEMLIKDWAFSDSPMYPLGSPYVTDGWSMVLATADEMVPFPAPDPNSYGELTNLSTIWGQNTRLPSEKKFARHFIVKVDTGLLSPGLSDPYFDPSYGVQYSDSADFERKAIAGYTIQDIGFDMDGIHWVAWTPTGTVNITFDH